MADVGRPLKFKSVEELQAKIDEYFLSCLDYKRDMFGNRLVDKEHPKHTKQNPVYIMKQVKPYTVTGLAVFLDTTRETLLDYQSGKYDDPDKDPELNQQFSDTIKRVKQMIYAYAEEQLFVGRQAAGPIFNLKNNYGWKDEKQLQVTDLRESDDKDIDSAIEELQHELGYTQEKTSPRTTEDQEGTSEAGGSDAS